MKGIEVNWVSLHESFDKINKQLEKIMRVAEIDRSGVFYRGSGSYQNIEPHNAKRKTQEIEALMTKDSMRTRYDKQEKKEKGGGKTQNQTKKLKDFQLLIYFIKALVQAHPVYFCNLHC